MINELTSRQKNNASVKELKLNENSVTNSRELSNAVNDDFSTIGTKLANEVPLVTHVMVQVMLITLLAATTSFLSVQLVVAMFFLY